MRAKFDDKLNFRADGRWLEACGPLDWKDPLGPQNANKVIVTVRITQNGVVAQGTSDEFDRPEGEWMIFVRPGPGQKFQAGPAQAIGTLTVTETDPSHPSDPNGPLTFSWEGSPTLQP
jgi:hypothetical protein